MLSSIVLFHTLAALSGVCTAIPYYMFPRVPQEHYEILRMRSSTEVNPSAVADVVCLNHHKHIVFHDENAAELRICGGIAGATSGCRGSKAAATTSGQSGGARFELRALEPAANVNMSKRRWESCVRAARAVCPTGSYKGICLGGASSGDVEFTLDNPPPKDL